MKRDRIVWCWIGGHSEDCSRDAEQDLAIRYWLAEPSTHEHLAQSYGDG